MRARNPQLQQWTRDLERAWRARLAQVDAPRASIGRSETVAAVPVGYPHTSILDEDARTQPVDADSRADRRAQPPHSFRHHRVIGVAAPGVSGELGKTEFELGTELGAGGMGRVFRARQLSLNREVAVKRIRGGARHVAPEAFESEASIAAVLEHPNIVPVYDLGVDQSGRVMYSMKRVEGTPWDRLLHANPTQPRTSSSPRTVALVRRNVEILLEVAQAVGYAHSRGIIHRDIKPENVMVGEFGEVLLVDWGLACALQPQPANSSILDLSQVEVGCGTPVYMPPEVASGAAECVGTWTDVYMLGGVLFEVLYGVAPHEQRTAMEAIRGSSANKWQFPAQVSPELASHDAVLRPVIERALATEPSARPGDGRAFAQTVRDALAHLDSAELATNAVAEFEAVQQRAHSRTISPRAASRALERIVAVLEQALQSWPDNRVASHHLVEVRLFHATGALEHDELSVARQQLSLLDHLPKGTAPSPQQLCRTEALLARLRAAQTTRVRRRRSVVLLKRAAGVLTALLLIGAVVSALLVQSARNRTRLERNHLSRLLLNTTSSSIEAKLNTLLEPVRGTLTGARGWVKSGRLDTDDVAVLTAYFLPLIDGYDVINSVQRSDDDGNEYMLLRSDDGWTTRMSRPGRPAVFQRLSARGEVLQSWRDNVDYDARARPWFAGAMAHPGKLTWTEPYTFFTTQEPGMTAALATRSTSGRMFVVGVDLRLTDLSTFTMSMPSDQHGKVFVIDAKGRAVGLPQHPDFLEPKDRLRAVLTPIADISEPVSARAVEVWNTSASRTREPYRFEYDGRAWWAGLRQFPLEDTEPLWIGVVLPEAGFS